MNALEIAQRYRMKDQKSVRFKHELAKEIREYAKQKCKEQREICKEKGIKEVSRLLVYGMDNVSPKEIKESILNAPEPEML